MHRSREEADSFLMVDIPFKAGKGELWSILEFGGSFSHCSSRWRLWAHISTLGDAECWLNISAVSSSHIPQCYGNTAWSLFIYVRTLHGLHLWIHSAAPGKGTISFTNMEKDRKSSQQYGALDKTELHRATEKPREFYLELYILIFFFFWDVFTFL